MTNRNENADNLAVTGAETKCVPDEENAIGGANIAPDQVQFKFMGGDAFALRAGVFSITSVSVFSRPITFRVIKVEMRCRFLSLSQAGVPSAGRRVSAFALN